MFLVAVVEEDKPLEVEDQDSLAEQGEHKLVGNLVAEEAAEEVDILVAEEVDILVVEVDILVVGVGNPEKKEMNHRLTKDVSLT